MDVLKAIHRAGHSAYLMMEERFNQGFGNAWNPFYHLGSLTFYFFWIVLVSGLYIFIFFETSVGQAYQSVEYITHQQWWLAGVMRSLHRYASDAAVLSIFLHMGREFFRDRYRGVRWFSWFTGVPTLWLTVILGITGYWLVWDQMAQYIALATAELVDWLPIAPGAMTKNFLGDGQLSDRFFTLMAFLHLLAFPVMMVFALWLHVSRISSVDFLPPKGLAVGSLAALTLLSLLKPALSHGPADLQNSPTVLHLDWFYLNIYPLMDKYGPLWAWVIPIGLTLFFMALPWLPPRKEEPEAKVHLPDCNGCGQCAKDCPFGAVSMRPRTDGAKFTFEPVVDPTLCTACGICTGSCVSSNPYRQADGQLSTGIDMPALPVEALRQQVKSLLHGLAGPRKTLLIGCRHGAEAQQLASPEIAVLILPCSGMVPPSFLDFALRQGADGVMTTACRDGDCYYRMGNTVLMERLARQRKPFLLRRTPDERVVMVHASRHDLNDLRQEVDRFRQRLDGLPALAHQAPRGPEIEEEKEEAHA
ncbi:MAG: hydrogenase iron-sulfur subunit [Magnetococcales bacterium]|nr:hydrogenase iron-sulfur subunit [Magnetococcales bacterium]